jgi:L-aminopeptidase/D-esterase-like protein
MQKLDSKSFHKIRFSSIDRIERFIIMRDLITDVLGIRVGNAQDKQKARGCTVVLCDNAKTAGVDVRGTLDPTGNYILDAYEEMKKKQDAFSSQPNTQGLTTHTTIGVVATNAILSKPMATRMAMMAHDGYARSINPSHTSGDGDTIFSVATGEVESNIDIVGSMAAEAMARAIAKAIRYADSAYGYKSYSEMVKKQ